MQRLKKMLQRNQSTTVGTGQGWIEGQKKELWKKGEQKVREKLEAGN